MDSIGMIFIPRLMNRQKTPQLLEGDRHAEMKLKRTMSQS